MDERLYRALKWLAILLVTFWIAWSIYDGFFRSRTATDLALDAAHKAYADGNHAAARDGYRELLEDDPGKLDARRGLARSLMELGEYRAALVQFNRAIDAAPEFGATWANRGILHDRMGRYREALRDYRKALSLDPELAEGPGWLTRFLRNQADPPPTIADRADYLEEQLAKPPGERLLRVPERDAQQRSYRKEE